MQSCSSDYRYACSLWSQKVILRCKTESGISAECLQGLSKHVLPVPWQVVGIKASRMEQTPNSLSSSNLHSKGESGEQLRYQN